MVDYFDEHITDQGLIDPKCHNRMYNTTIYAEYGISDRFTAMVYAPVLSRNVMNNLISATTEELMSKEKPSIASEIST